MVTRYLATLFLVKMHVFQYVSTRKAKPVDNMKHSAYLCTKHYQFSKLATMFRACREVERLPTEGKIFSKYYNISKLMGGVLSNSPLYHGEGMTLCVLSRVNLFFCALYLE